jgi:ubiquinone/menaquinone biosynthesis C-methylase UbiE
MTADPTAPSHLAKGKAAESTDLIIARRHRVVNALARPTGGILLDFGCGSGAQTLLFAPQFARTIAVDVDEAYVAECARRVAQAGLESRVRCIAYDGRTLPVDSQTVDFAVSFEVLEHVDDEARALSELNRVLKPGGTLALSVPNRWWVFETHGAALPLLPWNRVPFFSWLPKSLHDRWARARIYSRREIVRKLTDAGFDVHSAVYVTAPMDVVRDPRVQRALRALVFRGDRTPVPFLSTAVLAVATRPR